MIEMDFVLFERNLSLCSPYDGQKDRERAAAERKMFDDVVAATDVRSLPYSVDDLMRILPKITFFVEGKDAEKEELEKLARSISRLPERRRRRLL